MDLQQVSQDTSKSNQPYINRGIKMGVAHPDEP